MRRLLASACLLMLTAACGSAVVPGSPPPPPSPVALTAAADQLVFQVYTGPAFSPPDVNLGLRPSLTVYGNGDAWILAHEQSSRFPERPLAFTRATLSHRDLGELVTAAARSALFPGVKKDLGDPMITDSATTTVTFRPGRGPARTVSAYALGYREGDDRLAPQERDDRRAMRALIDRAEDLADSAPAGRGDAQPQRLDVTASADQRANGDRALRWPGPKFATLLRPSGRDSCGEMRGAAARRVYAEAADDPTGSWDDGTAVRRLVIRVLLPGEPACAR